MRPSAAPPGRRCRRPLPGGVGVALEQRVLGLGVERRGRLVEHEQQRVVAHEAAGQRQLLPLAERHLDAVGPGRAELRVEPGGERGRPRRRRRPGRRRAVHRRRRRRAAARRRARPTWRAAQLEAEEVLERAGQARRATRRPACAPASAPSTRMRAARRLVELGQQLDQRRLAGAVLADERDDRAGRQVEVDVVEHQPLGARVGERHVVEADAVVRAGRAPAGRRSATSDGGVVLEPGQAPGAVEPDAAQEADLADGRADVGRQPRARRRAPAARRPAAASRPDGHEHDGADVGQRRTPPTPACATARCAQRAARDRAVPRAPTPRGARATSAAPMPVTRTSLPGGAVVAVTNRWRARRSGWRPRSSAARSTPGRHVEVSTVGSANTRAGPAPGGSTPAAPTVTPSRRIQPAASRTATCTCGRARRPGRAAPTRRSR